MISNAKIELTLLRLLQPVPPQIFFFALQGSQASTKFLHSPPTPTFFILISPLSNHSAPVLC